MKCEQCGAEMELREHKGKKVWWCPNPNCGWMEAEDKTWQGFSPPPGA